MLTNSTYLSFLFYDFIFFFLMIVAFRNYNLPLYAYVVIIIFPPFFLGSQNIIRQNYAAVLIMFAVSLSGTYRKFFLLVTSAFIHNISAIFLVLITTTRRRFFLACIYLSGCFLIIHKFYSSKVAINTGSDLSLVLLMLTLLILTLTWKLNVTISKYFVYIQFMVVTYLAFILSPGEIERLCYFVLLINYPMIIRIIEKFAPQQFLRLLFVLANSVVIFYGPQAGIFLFQT